MIYCTLGSLNTCRTNDAYRGPKKRRSRLCSLGSLLSSHCQTTNDFHPSDLRSWRAFSSRERFRSNFILQNALFDFGIRDFAQPCQCQKQPWTKITLEKRESTISGIPGKSLRCRLNRYPSRWSILRTANSVEVFCLGTRDIISLRESIEKE